MARVRSLPGECDIAAREVGTPRDEEGLAGIAKHTNTRSNHCHKNKLQKRKTLNCLPTCIHTYICIGIRVYIYMARVYI